MVEYNGQTTKKKNLLIITIFPPDAHVSYPQNRCITCPLCESQLTYFMMDHLIMRGNPVMIHYVILYVILIFFYKRITLKTTIRLSFFVDYNQLSIFYILDRVNEKLVSNNFISAMNLMRAISNLLDNKNNLSEIIISKLEHILLF